MRFKNPRGAVVAAVITTFILLLVAFPVDITSNLVGALQHPLGTKETNVSSKHDRIDSKSDDYRVLTSTRNVMGFYNKIVVKKRGLKIMNPTLLELPRGSKYDFLVIARAPHVDKQINGTKYKLARQVAMFANLTYNKARRPELTTGTWSKLLVQDFVGPEHHCKNQPKMDKYIGPEDMKLFWTRKGAPLLIFTNQVNDENLCEGMFLIDARAAVPELVKVLAGHALQMPPVQFQQPTGLRRQAPAGHEADPRYQREKNWAPVQSPFSEDDDELLFMVEPCRLFRWASSDEPVEEIGAEPESAVEAPYPPGIEAKMTRHSAEMTVTLCNRGTCEPHEGNTVMIGMVQRRYDPPGYPFTWYDRRIAAYASTPPYNMMSVSKKLTYHGEVDRITASWMMRSG
ncbi:hypothetical protein G7Z17_g109 [Cylindrodendrum hubeiense]|uniref:Uncharacterized protein n=1 Tax=Cylindrodendrum hubeiense TaxID=595255 RepID=A0A9P5HND9_9HYPO|nr:hypothetical protein G7Z17_g109 [Cylindrodendrum hubeiense]